MPDTRGPSTRAATISVPAVAAAPGEATSTVEPESDGVSSPVAAAGASSSSTVEPESDGVSSVSAAGASSSPTVSGG